MYNQLWTLLIITLANDQNTLTIKAELTQKKRQNILDETHFWASILKLHVL